MRRTKTNLIRIAKLLGATALSTAVPSVVLAQTAPPVVAADQNTQVYAAGNGATVVNIATPNAAGVSHNRFDRYNVPTNGAVLNNGGLDQQTRQSELAGSIAGNRNITGNSASLIINEVVKAGPSLLQGYTEILGGRAGLVVANPWVVTCDGCGFLNTAQLVMTTGVPQIGADGRLSAIRTTDGLLTITGKGLDASAADTLALVARTIKIDGQVNAKAIDVVGGASNYDPTTGEFTVIAPDKKAEYAIDASALGSLYAGRIRLIATDAGVGVRALGNVGASAGDLTITSAGQIVLGGRLSATGAVAVNAQGGDLASDHAAIAAGTDLGLSARAGRIALVGGQINAGRDLNVAAAGFSDNGGSIAAIDTNRRDAARAITFSVAGDARFAGSIWGGRTLTLGAQSLAVAGGALAADSVSVRANAISLDTGGILGKTIDIVSAATINVTRSGFIQGQNAVSVSGLTIDNSGRITTGQDTLSLTGALTNSGAIQGYRQVVIAAGQAGVTNRGTIAADTLALTAGTLINSGKTEAVSGAVVTANSLDNSGTLTGSTIATAGLTLIAPTIANTGTIGSAGRTDVSAATRVANGGTLIGDTVVLTTGTGVNSGTLQAANGTTISATEFLNSGALTGALKDGATVSIAAPTFENSATGTITSAGALTIVADGSFVNGGKISAIGDLAARTLAMLNNAGTLASTSGLSLRGGGVLSTGTVQSGTAMTVSANRAVSLTGTTIAGGNLTFANLSSTPQALSLGGLVQAGGTLATSGRFGTVNVAADGRLLADRMALSGGAMAIGGLVQATSGLTLDAVSLQLSGALTTATAAGGTGNLTLGTLQLTNQATLRSSGSLAIVATGAASVAGRIIGNDSLAIDTAQAFSLTGTAVIGTNGALTLRNRAGGVTIGADAQIVAGSATVVAAGLNNAGSVQASAALSLDTSRSAAVNDGTIAAGTALTLASADLANAGRIGSGTVATLNVAALANSGLMRFGGEASLTAASFANRGTFAGLGTISVAITGDMVNIGGFRASRGLTMSAATLDNAGTLYAATASGSDAAITAGMLTNRAGALLFADNALTMTLGRSFDNAGTVVAGGTLSLGGVITSIANTGLLQSGGAARFDTGAAAFTNTLTGTEGGRLVAGSLELKLASLISSGLLQSSGAASVSASGAVSNNGTFNAQGTLAVTAATIGNAGTLQALGGLGASASGAFTNSGRVVAAGAAGTTGSITAGDFANTGTVASLGGLAINWTNSFASGATLYAAQDLALRTNGTGSVTLDGVIQSGGGDVTIAAGAANLSGSSTLSLSGNNVTIVGGALANLGRIQANGNATITLARTFDNAFGGVIYAANRGLFSVGGAATNSGSLQSSGGGSLSAASFANSGLFIASTDRAAAFAFDVGALSVANGGRIQGVGDLAFTTRSFSNLGTVVTSNGLRLSDQASAGTPLSITSGEGSVLQAGGLLDVSAAATDLAIGRGASWLAGTLAITAKSLDLGGLLQSSGEANISIAGTYVNSGALYVDKLATISAASIANSGRMQGGALNLTATGEIDNVGGLIVAGTTADAVSTIAATRFVNTAAGPGTNGNIPVSGVQSAGDLNFKVAGAIVNRGDVLSAGNLILAGANLDISNYAAGLFQAGKTLDLTAFGARISVQEGKLYGQSLKIDLAQMLTNTGEIAGFGGTNSIILGELRNQATGKIYFGAGDADAALSTIRANAIVNAGSIQSDGRLTTYTASLVNSGKILAATIPTYTIGAGVLDLRFTGSTANSLQNSGTIEGFRLNVGYDGAPVAAQPTGYPNAQAVLSIVNNGGRIVGTFADLRGNIDNSNGVIGGLATLTITADTIVNHDAKATIYAQLSPVYTTSTANRIAASRIDNHGMLGSGANLTLAVDTLNNYADGGISAGELLTITRNRTLGDRINNQGAIFANSIYVDHREFSNAAGASVDATNTATFGLIDFFNRGRVTVGSDLSITANTILNTIGDAAVTSDAPAYWNPNWTADPNKKNLAGYVYIYDDVNYYNFVRLQDNNGNRFYHAGIPDEDGHNNYTLDYYFTESFVNGKPSAALKPQLISNGNMSLTFNTALNRGGVISATNTLTLTGQDASARFTNDAVPIFRTFWSSSWTDSHYQGHYYLFESYQQHVTRKELLDSVGASVSAGRLAGTNFGLTNSGITQNGTITPGRTPGPVALTTLGSAPQVQAIQTDGTPATGTGLVAPVGTVTGNGTAVTTANPVGAVTASGDLAVGIGITPTVTAVIDAVVRSSEQLAPVLAENYAAGIRGSFSGPASITFGTAVVTLPTSPNGRFVQTTDPTAAYLVETNPLFTSGQDAVGLNLLASLLDLNPDGLIRRLGDAQYEDYLIRTQLVDQIGTNLIARGLTQGQQTEALIRSASSQAKPLGLTYGKALTPAQQSALKTDLVWMVATSVNGQTVLAPVVYLSAATRNAFDSSDATIAANYANLALTSLVNNGGTITGNVLAVNATGDITNTSGRISGGKVLLTAGGNVTNETFAQYGGTAANGSTQIGATGSIQATEGLLIEAKGDIRNVGADLFSGGPTALIAGKSITIESIADKHAFANNDLQTSRTTNTGSNVTLNGDLFAKAGDDFTLAGSKLAVAGLASIDAGRDVNIVSRTDTTSKTTHETGGTLVSRTSTDITETTSTSRGSTLTAGELYVKSGANTNVQGSSITVAKDAFFDVGGDLQIRADTDKTTRSEQTRETGLGVAGGLFGDEKVSKYNETGTNVGSSIQIGGKGVAIAQGDVNLVGSTMRAEGTLGVQGTNVRVLDGQTYSLSTSRTETMSILGSGAGGEVGANAQASGGVYAGGNYVGGSASGSGSASAQASSNGNTAVGTQRTSTSSNGLDAREHQLDSEGEKTERSQNGANSAGFAGQAEAGTHVNGNASVSLAQYSTTETRDYSSKSVGSELSSGDKLTVIADKDLAIRGSKVTAAKDALLAGTNVTVQTGKNIEEHSSETMTSGVGIFIDSKNQGKVTAQAQGSVGTTGTSNVGGRDLTNSSGGISTGGNLGETGGGASVSLDVSASSANNVDFAQNSQISQSSRSVTNTGSEIAAGGALTIIAKDKLSVTGSSLSGDAGVGLKAKNMEFLAAQDTTSTSSGNRMTAVGVFADAGGTASAGAGLSADSQSKGAQSGAKADAAADAGAGVQARNTMDMASTSSSTAVTTSIKSSTGDIVRLADNNITDEGTKIEAKGDLVQMATTWNSKAARNTSSASASTFVDRIREGVFAEAGAGTGVDASAQGSAGTQSKSASSSATGGAAAGVAGGVLHSDEQKSEVQSTAVVSTITTGGRVVSVTSGKTSLEGTTVSAGGDFTLAAGALDWTAAKDMKSESGLANKYETKAQIGVDAEKLGTGYGSLKYNGSGSNGSETTSRAGSVDAGGKVTIVSQGATNLEGTTLASKGDMTLYSKGDLNYTAATDTKQELTHDQKVGGSISFAGKRGENAAVEFGVGVGSTDETTATAGSMTSGGKLTVVSDGNANFQGTQLKGAGDTAIVAAGDLTLGTADSTKNNYEASVGLGLSTSRAGETSGTGMAVNGGTAGAASGARTAATGTSTRAATGIASPGWTGATTRSAPAAAAPAGGSTAGTTQATATTTASSGLLARSNEDQQVGLKANASFGMEKSTERSASSVESTTGNVVLKSGGNMNLAGTDITAGGTAFLDAGKNLNFGTADSNSIKVDAELDLLGTRGSPGGVGTHVTDRSVSASTEGKGNNNAVAGGTQLNDSGLNQSAGATADTKLAGGIGVGLSAGYSDERKAGSIDATNIVTRSGGTTTFTGTDLNASKNIDITAAGDVKFDTAKSVSVDGSIGFGVEGQGNPGRIGGKTADPAAPAKPQIGTRTNTAPAPAAPSGTAAGTTAPAAPARPSGTGTTTTAAPGAPAGPATPTAAKLAEEKEAPVSGGVTDAGIGVAVTNKGSAVNAGGTLTINAGGKVSMDGTTGTTGSSAINAVGGVDRTTAVSGNAEVGLSRAGAGLDIQTADLGLNGTTQTGNAARGAVSAALGDRPTGLGEVSGAVAAAAQDVSLAAPAVDGDTAALSAAGDAASSAAAGGETSAAVAPVAVVAEAPTIGGAAPEIKVQVALPKMAKDVTPIVTLPDGTPAPSWVKFDPATGTLTGTPPADFSGSLKLVVTVPGTKQAPIPVLIGEVR